MESAQEAEPLALCDHRCIKDEGHVDRGEPHFYGYALNYERDMLKAIFARQLDLQVNSFGIDPHLVVGVERERYVDKNFLAIVAELIEALNEIEWKSWAQNVEHGTFHDRDAFVKELVDLLHFVMNLLLLADCSATELYNRYMKKADVNARRQSEGYDARSTKDASGRALDEPD